MEIEQMTLRETVRRAIYEANPRVVRGGSFVPYEDVPAEFLEMFGAETDAAIAAVRQWDVAHPPSEAEIDAVNMSWRSSGARGETFRESIGVALRAAAEVRAGGEQHV